MNIREYVKNTVQAQSKTNNSLQNEANQFLRYGTQKPLVQNWSQVKIRDEDMYTGYSYAAITKRANRTTVLGKNFISTTASPATTEQYKASEMALEHPYLKHIKKSKAFSERRFWLEISTYLDLEGVYYLMAVRNSRQNRNGTLTVGAVQKFALINPYEIRKVVNQETGEVGGYVESHGGLYREIPPEMIIEIKLLNPFDKDLPYSMADAAKESQFTLKQAGDYTRQTINGNISSPGIITTDVILDQNIFDNFKSRIIGKQKGEPIFGNGSGAVNWQDMQIDLDKASLDKVNEIQRAILFAVSGTSKTAMGIEESGTGREVSKTQRDDFTENAIIPRVEDIIDALNLDYRANYIEWEENEFELVVENPLESDRDSEAKAIKNADSEYELAKKLYNEGYEWERAYKYAYREISLSELGEPTRDMTNTAEPAIEEPEEPVVEPVNQIENNESLDTKDNNQISAKDYEDILTDIVPDDLGCIMVNTKPISILKHINNPDVDLMPDIEYGNVPGEMAPHVTLLYGLLENGHVWKDKVNELLKDWQLDEIIIDKVDYFDLGDSKVIIGKVKLTDELLDGHNRLTLLPHVNTFSEYIPHISLAYIKSTADVNKWIDALSIYNGVSVKTTGLNYGDKKDDDKDKKDKGHNSCSCGHCNAIEHGELSQAGLILAENSLDSDTRDIVKSQENSLQAGIANIEARLILASMNKITKNEYEEQSDVISAQDKADNKKELETLLIAYYMFLFPIYAKQLLAKRASEYGYITTYKDTNAINHYIKDIAIKTAESHIDTIINDIINTSESAYNQILDDELLYLVQERLHQNVPSYIKILPNDATLEEIKEAIKAGKFDATKAYKEAEKLAKNGESRDKIARTIQQEYENISKTRAATIARTETARAFNQSQFQADTQFLNDSGLMNRAYKKLRSRSGSPCIHCQALIDQPPIPFEKSFAELGSELTATVTRENGSVVVKKLPINYESIDSGNVHPNCQCEYVLIIEGYNK